MHVCWVLAASSSQSEDHQSPGFPVGHFDCECRWLSDGVATRPDGRFTSRQLAADLMHRELRNNTKANANFQLCIYIL